jgi:predicted nucleic acid-binding protein
MILLDTNVLSELMKPDPESRVTTWLDAQLENEVMLSAITLAEIDLGIAILPDGMRKEALSQLAVDLFREFDLRILPFDYKAAPQYAKLVAQARAIGRTISVEDAQIAAIAIVNDLTLATRNTKDFEFIANLVCFNPWEQ